MLFATEITISGKPVIINIPQGSRASRKANSIFLPQGPSHSTAYFCMVKRDLDALDKTATTVHSIIWKQVARNDDGSPNNSNSRTLTFSGWRYLRSSRVLPGGKDDPSSLFLVEFVDARYIAKTSASTGPNRSRLRSYAHDDDFLTNPSVLATWESLIGALWSDCGVLGSFPGLPAGLPIDGQPEGHWLIGLNAWRALCAVLDQLDCAINHESLNGNNYTISQLGEDQEVEDNLDRLQMDAQPNESNVGCAETVSVHFYFHRKNYGQERDTELATNHVVVGASDVIDVATDIEGAVGTKFLWDDLSWVLDELDTQVNGAALTIRANNRKARYVTRNTVEAQHKIYSGLIPYQTGGQLRGVLYRNYDDGATNDLGGTCTEILGGCDLPMFVNDGTVVWFDKEVVTPESEQYGPPDYGRHTYATYPRLPNIVQVFDEQHSTGALIHPSNFYNFHHGRVKRWVTNSMATPDDPYLCWILFVDDYDTILGNVPVKNGDYFGPARLSGVTTVDGFRRPVYLVRANEVPLVFFEVRQNKNVGTIGPVSAEILEWDGSDWVPSGTMIYVDDYYRGSKDPDTSNKRGFFTAKQDMDRGWAKYYKPPADENDLTHYIIIWMTGPSHIVEFELTADRTYGDPAEEEDVSADVLRTYLYGHEAYMPEGQNKWVRFPEHYFPLAKTGAKGTAIYDDESTGLREYRVVQCDQLCLTATAILSDDLCGDVSANVDEFDNATPYPHSQVPADAEQGSLEVLNLFAHRGESGDMVFLALIEYLQDYVIIDIVKKNMVVSEPPLIEVDQGGGESLNFYCATLAVEYCEPPELCVSIPLNECVTSGSGGSG